MIFHVAHSLPGMVAGLMTVLKAMDSVRDVVKRAALPFFTCKKHEPKYNLCFAGPNESNIEIVSYSYLHTFSSLDQELSSQCVVLKTDVARLK